jgi:hypothetical protein
MTFLQLVQRLHRESGLQGPTPSAVTGLSGMDQRLVDWILSAYEDIQSLHESWLFRQVEFAFPTIASTQNYTPTALGYTDLGAWKFDPDHNNLSGIRIYSAISDEQDLVYVPWDEFRATYKLGSFRTQSGRPTIFSIKPDMSMDLWAIPDAVYTVNGEYIKNLQTMTANGDIPIMPDFHMAIVWKALMLYGAFEGAPEAYAHGQAEYAKLIAKLEINQLSKLSWGSPLT